MDNRQRFQPKSTENIGFRQLYSLLVTIKNRVDEISMQIKQLTKEKEDDDR